MIMSIFFYKLNVLFTQIIERCCKEYVYYAKPKIQKEKEFPYNELICLFE